MEMVNEILEVAMIAIGIFLIERYVFLVPRMAQRPQRIFYAVTAACIAASFAIWGKDVSEIVALLCGGVNIAISYPRMKLLAFFLILPISGILNGIAVPLFMVPLILVGTGSTVVVWYRFGMYMIVYVLLLVFLVKGRDWRQWMVETLPQRRLSPLELGLLIVVGVLMIFFSGTIEQQVVMGLYVEPSISWWLSPDSLQAQMITISALCSLMLVVTMVTLVFQGNKRAFMNAQVIRMQSGMIDIMAEIVESRDENTGGHIKRTAMYVGIIANALLEKGAFGKELTPTSIGHMKQAAPLHDIGKIHVPDAILNKPGKLTDEEFEAMKEHAPTGRDLLVQAKEEIGDAPYIDTAIEMAGSHHERWDGTGYPDGLAGSDIPLCARIMAVADVFDALTAKRVYKDAMPLDKAFTIIEEGRGTHFDPEVVDAFLEKRGKIEEAFEKGC